MTPRIVVCAVAVLLSVAPAARAGLINRWFRTPFEMNRRNAKIHGRIDDYTRNHGSDRRVYSPALDCKRDLYVYLPPGYDPCATYPLVMFFHGFAYDEQSFLDFIIPFDKEIAAGRLPPMIVAAPDGSMHGRPSFLSGGSFYVNSRAGNFEDYVMNDVWDFLHRRYPIRPEREAHVLLGGSMGGFSAYNLGIKYRDRVGVVMGIFPPLNLRYLDCHGRYLGDFDPNCYGWRTQLRPFAPIARFACGTIAIRERRLVRPLFGRDKSAINRIASENPVEMLDAYGVQPGELEMWVGYVGRDAFNMDAQVESFLHIVRNKGFTVTSVYHPEGRHNMESGVKFIPEMAAWLAPRLWPYSPTMRP